MTTTKWNIGTKPKVGTMIMHQCSLHAHYLWLIEAGSVQKTFFFTFCSAQGEGQKSQELGVQKANVARSKIRKEKTFL